MNLVLTHIKVNIFTCSAIVQLTLSIFFVRAEFRKIVVSSVLATDMALHHEYVSKIKEQAVRFDKNATAASNTIHEDEERILLCSALIKCADISNVARPFHWGTQWAELLVKEFTSQGDLEKELGMSVLPMNDRDKVVLEDTQIDFIRFVALDLFQNVRQVLVEISFAVEQMQNNLKQWESRKIANSRTTSSGEEDDTLDAVFNSSATHAGTFHKINTHKHTNTYLNNYKHRYYKKEIMR